MRLVPTCIRGSPSCFPKSTLPKRWCWPPRAAFGAAVDAARAAAARAAGSGADGYESLALAVAAQLGDSAGAPDCASSTRVYRARGCRSLSCMRRRLQRADSSALEEVGTAYEEIGDLVAAADATAQAAFHLHAAARTREALRTSQRASALAERAQGARTFALRRLEHPPSLSTREYEIARLAAEGLSNRAIADLLGISVRTVEGHILRALAKSGLSNRAALAACFASAGVTTAQMWPERGAHSDAKP